MNTQDQIRSLLLGINSSLSAGSRSLPHRNVPQGQFAVPSENTISLGHAHGLAYHQKEKEEPVDVWIDRLKNQFSQRGIVFTSQSDFEGHDQNEVCLISSS